MLQGFSSLSCVDNLYKGLSELSSDMFLVSDGLKDKLTKPLIAAQYELNNQILSIDATSLPMNYCHSYYNHRYQRYVTELTKEIVYLNYNRLVKKNLYDLNWLIPSHLLQNRHLPKDRQCTW